MVEERLGMEEGREHWFIDLDWYKRHNRSFPHLARGCLCARCRERMDRGEISEAKLVANIKECCSKLPDFINGEMAVLESIFRLFLANGNEPLNLADLSVQLSNWLGGDTYRASAEVLSRLLKDERYYGIKRVPT